MKRVALLAVTSCAMFSTEPYTATADMHLYVTIDATDARARVTAQLTGPVGRVELGPNDSLALAVDDVTIVSARVTSFAFDVASQSHTFAFSIHHEGDHDADATITLVPMSSIRATSAGGKLLLDWTPFPNGGATSITVTGTCIHPQTIAIQTDTGHYELLAGQLQTLPASCAITVGLTRQSQPQVTLFGVTFLDALVSRTESGVGTWTP